MDGCNAGEGGAGGGGGEPAYKRTKTEQVSRERTPTTIPSKLGGENPKSAGHGQMFEDPQRAAMAIGMKLKASERKQQEIMAELEALLIIAAEMKLADPLMVGKWAVEILCTEQGAVSATVAWGREQEVATNRARMVAIKQQLEEAQEQVSYLKVNLEAASSVAADKEEAARLELEKMREELNVETARRGAERVRTQAVEADLVKARDALEAELEKARDALEDVQEELAVATTWHEEDEACLQASRADLAVVQAELAVAQAGLQKAQADLAEEAGRTRGAQAGMETTRADLDKARAELEKMRSDLAVATAKRAEEEAHSRAHQQPLPPPLLTLCRLQPLRRPP
eukprot:jgi/Mesvir1/8030/Mv06243-RA.1